MIFQAKICIIDPRSLKATSQIVELNIEKLGPSYNDIINEFFRNWDKADKYDICYALGVEYINEHDN